MVIPKSMSACVCTIKEAMEQIPVATQDNVSTLILMKTPETLVTLLEKGAVIPMDLNIGPMSKRPETQQATSFAYLLKKEVEAVKYLDKKGVHVWFRQIPGTPTTEWKTIAKNV